MGSRLCQTGAPGTLAPYISAPGTHTSTARLQTGHHLLPRTEMIRYWLLSEEDRKHIERTVYLRIEESLTGDQKKTLWMAY